MVDTIDMVDKLLADLKNIGGVEASIAASRDGLLIRGNMPKEKLLASLAAMSATMLGVRRLRLHRWKRAYLPGLLWNLNMED